jgi:hypothetical protein
LPISNLAIQRRRINELKRLGYKAEPTEFNNYTKFGFQAVELNGLICGRLKQAGFYIDTVEGDQYGLFVIVTKEAEERKQSYIRKQIAETLK